MAQYLKSLVTGVVLPYNEPALKCADIRLMEPAECEEYEASLGSTADPSPDAVEVTPTAEVEEPVVEEPVVGEHVVEDFDPDVEGVLGALEID